MFYHTFSRSSSTPNYVRSLHQHRPVYQPQDYIYSRQYLNSHDLGQEDHFYDPKPSWSLKDHVDYEEEDCFVFPKDNTKPPVIMIHLSYLHPERKQ